MISVIICTYNREKYIYNVLESIAKNNYPRDEYEIILINNNSSDHTERECLRFQSDFQDVIFRYFIETQQGLSFARNRGIDESEGEVLVFLDDDAFVGKNYLSNLSNSLKKINDNHIAFGGKIVPVFESGETPKWLSPWSFSFVSAIDKGTAIKEFKGKSYPIGANMGFYKECIRHTGNFDSNLGRCKRNLMGGEEKDLFLRFRKRGYKIYYLPDITVKHIIPESRTTYDYIGRLGDGVGRSENIRCRNKGFFAILMRYFAEIIKWGASVLLWFRYAIQGQTSKGYALLLFRWHVTKGLLKG
jgi:glycosyltransferase involved in cell wall biosynthesis